jgi:hypothetical protein
VNDENGPRLVDTGRGFSLLYRNRHLYSRYDPSKNPLLTSHNALIKPETLVLCFSPLLGYGLDILLEKLHPSSRILAVECDENLMSLSAAQIDKAVLRHPSFKYIRTSSVARVLETLAALGGGPFRRCLRIDLSGGASLNPEFYAQTLSSVDEYISRFWRNRLTLMRLGRNFSRNFFRNCALLAESFPIPEKSSGLPVFVAAAGPSLETTLPFLRAHRAALFLLCVDTALAVLREAGISPDAIILVESQFWIDRAFIGFRNTKIPVFADMTARTSAILATGGPVHFFFSEYAKALFIESFLNSGISPTVIPPLGSVGIAAVYLARMIAKSGVPVLFSGLDFSWGTAYTHSRGSPPVAEILNASSRFIPAGTNVASLNPGVFRREGKNGGVVFTDPSMEGYARLFESYFGGTTDERFYDCGETGMPNGCAKWPGKSLSGGNAEKYTPLGRHSGSDAAVREYLEREKVKLYELKEILCGNQTPENAEKRVEELIRGMDYLYLHFPDGHRGYSPEANFLKRVRVELDYFLKTLNCRP